MRASEQELLAGHLTDLNIYIYIVVRPIRQVLLKEIKQALNLGAVTKSAVWS
jgi:hypothetical protein